LRPLFKSINVAPQIKKGWGGLDYEDREKPKEIGTRAQSFCIATTNPLGDTGKIR
jgi:hypothetical protein